MKTVSKKADNKTSKKPTEKELIQMMHTHRDEQKRKQAALALALALIG